MNGMIEWFARNSVAANLVMAFIVVSGLLAATNVREEAFPEMELDRIQVEVPYLGAAPEEVEQAVNVRIEEAIQGIDGIRRIRSTASEGMGTVLIELDLGADARRVVDEVKSNIDAITTFPIETEKPIIRELTSRQQVVDIAVSGDIDPFTLKQVSERVRDELTAIPEITQVDLVSAPPYEISIEVSEDDLRRHGLTFDQVAQAVRRSSLDLPGGSVRTERGEILLRTIGQAYRGAEFEDLVLWTRPDGSRLQLGDVATVVDGFEETDQYARFDVEPTMMVSVFGTGDQSAIELAALATEYVEEAQARLPEGVSLTVWQDEAESLSNQLALMLRSGFAGFAFVFLVLALFLELRLAFWVSLGIPISFLGAIALMPGLDVSFNMLSLFAFVLVLGIVVDDAIIVGENIYRHQEEHGDGLRGAIEGAREIARPVTFAVLTTVAAFSPLLFVPGMMGKVLRVIPLVVIPCLLFSLLESLNILPAHLSHVPRRVRRGPWRRLQSRFANGLKRFAQRVYCPVLDAALRWRYLTAAVGAGVMIVTVGLVLSGRPGFRFVPALEADVISASMTMPQGSPVETTGEAVARLEAGAARLRQRLLAETGRDHFVHVLAVVGDQPMAARGGGPITPVVGMAASHVGEVAIELAAPEQRSYRSEELGLLWRDATGPIPEAVAVDFSLSRWSGGGSDVDVQLAGPDLVRLRAAADEVKRRLREYAGVYEVTDSFRAGKEEMRLGIKPAAEALGLTLQDLGRQVRQAFYGEEAQRIQRGRDDIRVMVRYPRDERRSLGDLENMRIRTPDGGEVPFSQVAVVEPGRGFASIRRVDRNRAVNVTASVDATVTSAGTSSRPQRPHPPRGAGPPSRRVLHVRGDDGRAARRARRAAAGLRARAAPDLRAAGGSAPVLRAAAHHHERDPVRAHRRRLGPPLPGPRRLDDVDVRTRRGDRRRGQRQPDHGRLHQPGAGYARRRGADGAAGGRGPDGPAGVRVGRPRAGGAGGGRPPLPAHPVDLAHHLLRPRAADVEPELRRGVHGADGGLPRLRGALRDVHHADPGADVVHDPRRHRRRDAPDVRAPRPGGAGDPALPPGRPVDDLRVATLGLKR